MTDAFRRRRRRSFDSLERVRIRLRWAYLDQAIAIKPSVLLMAHCSDLLVTELSNCIPMNWPYISKH